MFILVLGCILAAALFVFLGFQNRTVSVPDGRLRLYGADGAFLALGAAKDGVCRTEKSFFEVG